MGAKRTLRKVFTNQQSDYWLTRFVFLRLLALVYLFAFLSLAFQIVPLVGSDGLLPAENYLHGLKTRFGSTSAAFFERPTLFFFHLSDTALLVLAWFGVILSLIVLIGFANVPILLTLWFLYLSFVHVGQIWYSFGWEIQLLETGFLALFLVPLWEAKLFPKFPPPVPIIWLLRWLTFRIHLGAGLIKIRGDPCWRDLTCLFYHYETQPIPNPVSRWLHFFPQWFHRLGVLWNHFIELIIPFFVFWPRLGRNIAGVLLISFQALLIISGNLSFLNWITVVAIIGCFDDRFLQCVLPKRLIKKAEAAKQQAKKTDHRIAWAVLIIMALLSVPVVLNLLSPNQIMNTSFNQWHLLNTYGAFGSVGKQRPELVVMGTLDTEITEQTPWREYEFKAKPTGLSRPLPIIAPYQPRVDWEIWFAAMSDVNHHPWMLSLVWKLLHNDHGALSLLETNPFPEEPPTYLKVERYRYHFVPPGHESGQVWNRTGVDTWLPPLSKETPGFAQFIKTNGWG